MELEEYARQVRRGAAGESLDILARSPSGEKLAAALDGKKLEAAAKAGDMQALGSLLRQVLATPEGKDFARQVQEAVKGHGK